MPATPQPGSSFTKSKRISQAIVKEISIVSQFPKTYRNREDITNLPPGVLVVGSQNILSNVSERLQTRQGYALDGTQLFYIQTTAISSNAVTLTSTASIHTGDNVIVHFTSGITGLTTSTAYYAIVTGSTTLQFATSNANAIAGTPITISGTPVGANLTLEKSSANAPILSSFDWNSKGNAEIHMRAGFLTSAANDGRLQFRWVDANSNIFWYDLLTGLTTVQYNFTTFWDTTELIRETLFVNGTSNIFKWNGAYDTFASTSTNALTFTVTLASPGVFTTSSPHGYAVGEAVTFSTTGALPTGLTAGTTYYIVSGGFGTSTFEVSATPGGTAVNTSGSQSGVHTVTMNTITVTNNIGMTGFYSQTAASQIITIRGVDYAYTGVSGSSFTGVTPTPSGVNTPYAGDIVVQKVVTVANSSLASGPPTTFANAVVLTSNNQLYLGSLTSPTIYVSKINNFTDFSFTAGTRLPGEGATATLDDNIVAFIGQGNTANSQALPSVYISCGKNFVYKTSLIQSSSYNGTTAITIETFSVVLIKTNPRQGFQSQGLVNNMKNDVIAVTFEPTFDTLGLVDSVLGTPQTTNISDSIKLDFDTYDFTYGHVFYNKYNLYVSVPKSGLIRMYSLITKSWEAPQIIPVTRFYTVNGNIYGHSYTSSESYQLFTGYSDRAGLTSSGNPYLTVANFSYQNEGVRTVQKNANKFYIEGYISGNTTLNCTINYEQDGNLTTQTFQVLGDDVAIIGGQVSSNSLGKNTFGQVGLGTETNTSLTGLPPKFRVIKTFPRFDYYECQFSFSILGIDQNFQLLAFGLNSIPSDTTSFAIEE